VSASGEFEIITITAGDAKGWTFPAQVLEASVQLWNNVDCFIDHAGWFSSGRSIRDLAGILTDATWNPEKQGISARLKNLGPAADIATQLGRQILDPDGPTPNVGFSADLSFSAIKRDVVNIIKVHSVDLVYSPARGGAFVRALNSTQGAIQMTETINTQAPAPAATHPDIEAARTILNVQQEQTRLAQEAEEARLVRLQMCAFLLDSGLAASKLPAAMQDHVRKQFHDKVFAPAELATAIDEARSLITELSGASSVVGPSRITGMFSSEDQLQLAVDDLMGVERSAAQASANVARLSGIRELYLMLTGDDDLHGGFYPSRVRLATTADFTGLVKNALNKIVANQWAELGRAGYDWWQRISNVEAFSSLQGITGTLVGTVGTLPVVAEGAEYTELAIGDSPVTASFVKYSGYIPLTLELIDRDETRELANAGSRRLSGLVAAIFTDNSAEGPTMADTGALFNATAVTTAGGHANLLTTALSAAEWEVVSAAVYNQPMLIKQAAGYYGTGPKQALNPRYMLVPRALQLTAMKILYPMWENSANIYSENQQRGAMGDVVTVPEWTDATDWAAACDPRIAPAIFVGHRFGVMPEVFVASNELSPAVFMNDEHRLKVRHFLAVWVNDFRPLHKSNV